MLLLLLFGVLFFYFLFCLESSRNIKPKLALFTHSLSIFIFLCVLDGTSSPSVEYLSFSFFLLFAFGKDEIKIILGCVRKKAQRMRKKSWTFEGYHLIAHNALCFKMSYWFFFMNCLSISTPRSCVSAADDKVRVNAGFDNDNLIRFSFCCVYTFFIADDMKYPWCFLIFHSRYLLWWPRTRGVQGEIDN